MKKSNRIKKEGATAPGHAQGKRPTKTPAAKPARAAAKSPIVSKLDASGFEQIPWALPYHRLLPRSASELHGLRKFVANLGFPVGSCVYKDGQVEHLFYLRDRDFLLVGERMLAGRSGVKYSLPELLEESHLSLEEYLRRHARAALWRKLDLETLTRAKAAEWAKNTGVEIIPHGTARKDLFGDAEAKGTTKGREILRFDSAGGASRILACAGRFTGEIIETGKNWNLSREDVLRIFRDRLFQMADRVLPEWLKGQLKIDWFDSYSPADAEDVKR